MGTLIIILVVLIFIIYPIVRAITEEDIERTNKKVEDYYKKREIEREEELKSMYTIVEVDNDNDD